MRLGIAKADAPYEQSNVVNHYILHLKPEETSDGKIHVSVDLDVRYPPQYPATPPLVRVINPNGLSSSQVTELQGSLDALMKSIGSREMIFDLAQHIEDYLRKHNVETLSFHQQMTNRQEAVRLSTRGSRRCSTDL